MDDEQDLNALGGLSLVAQQAQEPTGTTNQSLIIIIISNFIIFDDDNNRSW